jgi:hypothetical protein
MRAYSRVAPQFWTGSTGRALRLAGRDAQLLALYLVTCPAALMTGVFYLPFPTLCHDTGIRPARARAALEVLRRENFAEYDFEASVVWVPEMARCQVGRDPKPDDKRIKGFLRELEAAPHPVFVAKFIEKYREPFQLDEESIRRVVRGGLGARETTSRDPTDPLRRGSGGPSEGHRSPAPAPAPAPAPEPREKASRATSGDERPAVEGMSPEDLVRTWDANCGGMAETKPPISAERRRRLRAFARKRPGLTLEEFGAVVKALGEDPWACGKTPRRNTPLTIDGLLDGDSFERQREKLASTPRRISTSLARASSRPQKWEELDHQSMTASAEQPLPGAGVGEKSG